jgi:hypothetical protein
MRRELIRIGARFTIVALVEMTALSCTAPQYDDQTDKQITQLQTDIDTEIVSLISLDDRISDLSNNSDQSDRRALSDAKTKAGYAANTDFYNKIDVELITLRTRVDAEPSLATPNLDRAIEALHDNLLGESGSMRSIHKRDGIIPEAQLLIIQKTVDAQVGALLTRELGLKTGTSAAAGAGGKTTTL